MLDHPTLIEKNENTILQVPYDVEFDFKDKHYSMRLINNYGVQESILEKREDLESRGKLPRGRVFCLSIDEKGAKINVYSFSEKAFNYYHSNWVNSSLFKYQGEVENLQVKPVLAHTQKFELSNIWEADGKWNCRPSEDPIWQKAREIYPDTIPLGVLKTEEVSAVVEKLVAEADDKFRAIGATDAQIAMAPDYTNALVEYVGKNGFPVSSVNDWNSPVLFCEGNAELGYNAIIDFSALDLYRSNQFVDELCELLDFVGYEYVWDPDVKKQMDPKQLGKIKMYIGPDESLAQAWKRHHIDPIQKFEFNEWAIEKKHQDQLRSFASKQVEKAKDEYNEVFNMISEVVSDKELLAKSLEKLKARDSEKAEGQKSVQSERITKLRTR